MKKSFFLVLMLFFVTCFSQTHRFIYELKIKHNAKDIKMNMVLDIDKDFVKFYDHEFITADSISKRNNINRFYNTQVDQLVIRKVNSFDNKAFHDNMFDYYSVNSHDEIKWKIEKDTKKSGEYSLQKAVANFGGRSWTAWFCPAIPFQEGPYKFRGLPGLIFEITDKDTAFSYTLIKSKKLDDNYNTSNFLETHYGTKPLDVTWDQYKKIKLNYYNDPLANAREMLKNGGVINIGGTKITSPEQLDQKRKFMQESIKNYYHPVELDKVIPYPN